MPYSCGGINFSKPENAKALKRFDHRMQLIQLKYEMIYEGFGGDKFRAPKIYLSENRLPMLSLIKQQIRQIGELLSNADDYLVQRNLFGNYCVVLRILLFGVGYWPYNLATFCRRFFPLSSVILHIYVNQILIA